MLRMFESNNSIISLDLDNFDTSKVQNISFMFHYATNLNYLKIDKFIIGQIKDMTYMFTLIPLL